MANAKIDILGPGDLELIEGLYAQVFKPPHDVEFFQRRFLGKHNALIMIALVDDHPIAFFLGFELKPNVFYAWLFGVLGDFRRQGIASQLLEAVQAWAKERGYGSVRLECQNQHRPMLHLCISHGYDIVGIRWDADRSENLVVFEKLLD